jgi:hypothetical protein
MCCRPKRPSTLATLANLAPLLALVLFACVGSGCDTVGPGDEEQDRPCETFAGCVTLDGISQVRDEPFVVSDAVATDSLLYVALTSLTLRFDENRFNPDEVYVLSRRLGQASVQTSPETAPDSTWKMEQVSVSSDELTGGRKGSPTLSIDADGSVRLLWARHRFFRGGELQPVAIHEVIGRRGTWSDPTTIYEMPPMQRGISTGRLPAPMARDGQGQLHAAFRVPGETGFGQVMLIRKSGSGWRETGEPFGENTHDPWLTSASDGTLIAAYISLKRDEPTGLLVQTSSDGGQSWNAPKKLIGLGNSAESPNIRVYTPKVVETEPGTYHVLFPYDVPGQSSVLADQIWHSVSHDEGQTWSDPRPITPNDEDYAGNLDVEVDQSGSLHTVYYEGPFFSERTSTRVRHAVWNGSDWQQQPDLSQYEIMIDGSAGLALTVDPSGCLHAVWDEVVSREEDSLDRTTRLRYRQVGCS